jgi:Mob1/phocein family
MSLAPSSPRLPSPPPPAEIQIGPKSPSMSTTASHQAAQLEQERVEANSKRRIHSGTKANDMAAGPPLIPLNEVCCSPAPDSDELSQLTDMLRQLDSPFQLQEHLAALHYYHSQSTTQPITRTTAVQLATPPPSIDRTLWLYELCRFLIAQCNSLIVGFLFDTPPCSATTCPEMRASEWQFLCAVHEQPKSCCAIDYCCHTLDWAANVVTDPKIFPSRIVVLSDSHNKGVAVKNLVNVFRRLHRIFAHAWFQHRGVFWSVESQSGLYVFFKTVCDMYDLLPAENYKLPPEAEGLETATAVPAEGNDDKKPPQLPAPTIVKPPPPPKDGPVEEDIVQAAGRTNTRRHIRSSPSTGSAVTTVMEADEEDHGDVTRRLKDMHISAPETVEEESEVAEVPVIVEQSVMDEADDDTPSRNHAEPKDAGSKLEPDVAPFEKQPQGDDEQMSTDPDETILPPEEDDPRQMETETPKVVESNSGHVDKPDDKTESSMKDETASGLSSTSIHDSADDSAKGDSSKEATVTPQESDAEDDAETEAKTEGEAKDETSEK